MSELRITTTSSSLFLTPELPFHINRVSESFRLEQHKHEFVEINYVSEGSGYQYIEGLTIPVKKGDLFYLPVGASHVFRPSSPVQRGGGLIVYNCLFEQTFARQLAESFVPGSALHSLLGSTYPVQSWLYGTDRNGVLQGAFNTMLEEFRKQEAHFRLIIQAEIIRVLIHLERTVMRAGMGGTPKGPDRGSHRLLDASIDACMLRLREQPGERVTAAALASDIGLSERHFRRRFEDRTGMTFIEYVHKCRIETSCELLRATEDKVAAIARHVGYQDMKYFNKLFKLKTGLSPREYRMKNKSGELYEKD